MTEQRELQIQFKGWQSTPLLWENSLRGIEQFAFKHNAGLSLTSTISKSIYLGHLVEEFVFHEIENSEENDLLASNVQIMDHDRTIGEIDAIIKHKASIVHLEIAFKFYLFDDQRESKGLANWIGPNRRDSLLQKISKLKRQQFPLLENVVTTRMLSDLDLPFPDIQRVNFKGQLFLPFKSSIDVSPLNSACIAGYYYRPTQLSIHSKSKFYIPSKMNWLTHPHTNVDWLPFDSFMKELSDYLNNERSPMCWIKKNNGEIEKCFIVWW